jgi:glycolate oxidase FAD binding subunit
MNDLVTPTNPTELADAVRAVPRVIPVGAGTKPRLSIVDAARVSTAKLTGIIEYEPSEFTFTALAGTPVREIAATLAERGQYMPFDPMFAAAGATLGGTVASGLSGPGRFRFGGLRDFILGVRFVDGAGRLLRMGGKVVKNAAGFDLPKFFVGSLGRFGVLAEITFKVFPQQAAQLTLLLEAKTPEIAIQILTQAAAARWELHALDWLPDIHFVAARLAGPEGSLEGLANEILQRWPGEKLSAETATELWTGLTEFRWAEAFNGTNEVLLKIPTTPQNAAPAREALERFGAGVHVSAGGNLTFAALPSETKLSAVDEVLRDKKLSALTLRGNAPLRVGARHNFKICSAIKAALDGEDRFPTPED